MVSFAERIQVIIDTNFNSGGARQAKKSMDRLEKKFNSVNDVFERARGIQKFEQRSKKMQDAADNVGLELRGNGEIFDRRNDRVLQGAEASRVLANRIDNVNNVMSEGTQQSRKFRFEFLGLMFAGMALQKAMFGLLRPAFEAAGVFEIISSILEFLFLPTALDVLDIILEHQGAIFNMSEETRSMIGVIVGAAGALGTLLFAMGQIVLGIDSLGIAMGSGTGIIATFKGVLSKLKAPLSLLAGSGAGSSGMLSSLGSAISALTGPIGIIIALIIAFSALMITNFRGIRDAVFKFLGSLTPFLKFFGGLAEFVLGAWLEYIGLTVEAIGHFARFFFDAYKFLIAPQITALGSSFIIVANIIKGAMEFAIDWIQKLVDFMSEAVGPLLNQLISGFSDFAEQIRGALSFIPGIKKGGGGMEGDIKIDTAGGVTDAAVGVADTLGLGQSTKNQLRSFNEFVDAGGRVGSGIGTEIIKAGRGIRNTNVNISQNIDARSQGGTGDTRLDRSRTVGQAAEEGARNGVSRGQGAAQ